MSISSAISASRSTLMHASLAHFSPEVQTMDVILSLRPTAASRTILPTEILLLIRDRLFMTITEQLVKQSVVALEAYERSLMELLCSDCVAYNLDIYGPDIWQWNHFSGACACIPPGNRDMRRTTHKGKIRHKHDHISKLLECRTSIPNPKQFVDCQHWLETHLSSQVATLLVVGGSRHTHSMSSGARPLAPSSIDIWDVINFVLRKFNCEAVREPEDVMRTLQGVGRRQTLCSKLDYVRVVPVQDHLEPISNNPRPEPTQGDSEGRAQIVLHRVSRGLCLSLEYPEIFSTRRLHISSFARQLQSPIVSNSCRGGKDMLDIIDSLFYAVTGACLSFPLAFATALFTILCFYSKPKSLRIF